MAFGAKCGKPGNPPAACLAEAEVGNIDADATYFCQHFYRANCTAKPGYHLMQTPNPTYPKMHKNGGCTQQGSDIPNTMCANGPCKIGHWNDGPTLPRNEP